jgi:hypothetical protein
MSDNSTQNKSNPSNQELRKSVSGMDEIPQRHHSTPAPSNQQPTQNKNK